ncbi:MAG: hypothetical protein KHX55_02295 [Proteobacteria bacterium]|nr:hypothetical protein [Pseudomonadota bacterium]
MSYLEELLPEFRKGAKIRCKYWAPDMFIQNIDDDNIDIEDLPRDDWEFYKDPIDWDSVIRSRCPCWFWNGYFNEKVMRLLRNVEIDLGKPFLDENRNYWKNCRPVRRDEVTFYEDRKDE